MNPSVRSGSPQDTVSGVVPRYVAEPATAEEVGAVLAAATGERWSTVIRGSGTKLAWGRVPDSVDLVVSTRRLDSLMTHRHGDLTVTVASGATLTQLNRTLAAHRQWLPVESAFEESTIGGILATNDCGPSRHRNGTPRDLLIGATLALPDGRLVKAGGTVVKNVAGYDLGRLVCGSFGAYAAIVDATFKLMPIPQASATLTAAYSSCESLAADVALLTGSQIEPSKLDFRSIAHPAPGRAYQLLVQFASSPRATHAQVAAARALVHGDATTLTGHEETSLWRQQIEEPWTHEGSVGQRPAVVKLAWLPADLRQVLRVVEELRGTLGANIAGRAGIGTGLVTLVGDVTAQAAAIERLRAADAARHVVVLRGSRELKERLDVWGSPLASARVALSFKRMFDPVGILGAGRGPV